MADRRRRVGIAPAAPDPSYVPSLVPEPQLGAERGLADRLPTPWGRAEPQLGARLGLADRLPAAGQAHRVSRVGRWGSLAEGGAEVFEQVVAVLDADREPDQIGRHGQRRASYRGVRHRGRVLDERLDSAERLAKREQPGPPAHLDRRLRTVNVA